MPWLSKIVGEDSHNTCLFVQTKPGSCWFLIPTCKNIFIFFEWTKWKGIPIWNFNAVEGDQKCYIILFSFTWQQTKKRNTHSSNIFKKYASSLRWVQFKKIVIKKKSSSKKLYADMKSVFFNQIQLHPKSHPSKSNIFSLRL